MSLQPSRGRIAAVVLNSVFHDSRVIKEAESLAAAGWDITIFGIQDRRNNQPRGHTPGGVPVVLCSWEPAYLLLQQRLLHALLPLWLIASLVVSVALWHGLRLLVQLFSMQGLLAVGLFGLLAILGLRGWAASSSRIARRLQFASDAAGAEQELLSVPGRHLLNVYTEIAPMLHLRFYKKHYDYAVKVLDRALRIWSMRNELTRAIVAFAPDVVHCHDAGTLPVGLAVRQRSVRRVRLVYDSHEFATEIKGMDRIGRVVTRWRENQAMGQLDALITVNESIAAELGRRYPAYPPALVVCNATRPLPVVPSDDGRLRRAAGLAPSQRILLYQGGFSGHRGLTQAIQAAMLLPPDWSLVMMGWGGLQPVLEKLARNLDPAGERIRFVPPAPQAELSYWTAGAALGIIPYENVCLNHWYCSPNKLWEYPAAGVPVLVSPFPVLRERVERYGIGWFLDDPVTPEGIARVVAGLDDDSLAGVRAACERFIAADNWSLYEARLVGMYDRLL